MTEFALIETRNINDALVDGYYYNEDVWFTRSQIGSALGYEYPVEAIGKIHNRHRKRLDQFSLVTQIDLPVGKREGYIYSFRGVLEICRWSKQPKADEVMDALYDMAESVRKKGYYSCMSDNDLLTLLVNKCLDSPHMEQLLENKHYIPGMKKLRLREERENMRIIVKDYKRKSKGLIDWYSKHPSEEFQLEAKRIEKEALSAFDEQCPHLKAEGMIKIGFPIGLVKEMSV